MMIHSGGVIGIGLLGVVLVIVIIVYIIKSLILLGHSRMSEGMRFLWVCLILLLPPFGTIAIYCVRPGLRQPQE